MAGKQASGAAGKEAVPGRGPARRDPQRGPRRARRIRQDDAGRDPPGLGRCAEPGRVRPLDGTTVSDFDEAELRQQRSVGLALAPLVHDGVKVNLLDTPGYADFVGELRAGLRAADCAMFVVAANEGIDEPTRTLWRECADVGMPRVVVVTKLDHARADYDGVVRAGPGGVRGQGAAGLPARGRPARRADLRGRRVADGARRARDRLIEGVIEESEDETLMERYLGGEEVDAALLVQDLERAVARGSFHPVVPVDSSTGVGAARAARPGRLRLPVAARAPAARGVHARRAARART